MAKEIKSHYNVIGVMAGSSIDGLDLAQVSFSKKDGWSFELLKAKTFPYDDHIFDRLREADQHSRDEQEKIDKEFGEWIAGKIQNFKEDSCELIAVHGHTIIHQPENAISWQLGCGETISKLTGITTVSSFRSQDVKLGGQGAPLVPVGDFELFQGFDACLNLGGIANISVRDKRIAWDICPCNQVLNHYAQLLGHPFDSGGTIAREGQVNVDWIRKLKAISYFEQQPPKSLPNHFLDKDFLNQVPPETGLGSYARFVADQIVADVERHLRPGAQILVTGGGAFNTYLIELLNSSDKELAFIVPEEEIAMFKEAIVFGFLGVLRVREGINVLATVTGASEDSSSGQIHLVK